MDLKSIKLVGFKSFADNTTIPISSNLTAIVGPNGCGKSNVVDAVRWVIGEMSAKQLRGQSMADVIFNGASSRKPVGVASVELLFDNSDNRIGGEFAQYNEISIKREVEREGQSSYFLNGSVCRRRDILNIFLGTGLGSRSYAIIEQGMISRLIEAKPLEMRSHLEEAAGISKYKDRRRDTESRMKRTHENLDRVNDIREELATQLRRLKRQVNAAERYKGLKTEETQVLAQIKALNWKALNEKRLSQEQLVNAQKVKYDEYLSQQRHVEVDIEKSRQRQIELSDKENEVQKRYYSHASDMARIEQQIKNLEEQSETWESELTETQQLCTEIVENSLENATQIEELLNELNQLSPRLSNIRQTAIDTKTALEDAERNMSSWQKSWDEHQSCFSQVQKQYEVAKTTLEHLTKQLDSLSQRKSHLNESRDTKQVLQLESQLEPLSIGVSNTKDDLDEVQNTIDKMKADIGQRREENQNLTSQLRDAQFQLQQCTSKLASLEALQQAALSDEVTQGWVENNDLQSALRLGENIRVDKGWEQAVETVLSSKFNAICQDSLSEIKNKLSSFTQGSLTFIDKAFVGGTGLHSKAPLLLDLVQCDWSVDSWLMGIYAVDSLDEALTLQSSLDVNESIVTRDGVWVGPNWVRVVRSSEEDGNVLVRKSQIADMNQESTLLQALVDDRESELLSGEELLKSLEMQREVLHEKFKQLSYELTAKQAELSAKQSRFEEIQQQEERLIIEIAQAEQQIETLLQQQTAEETKIREFSDKVSEAIELRPRLEAQREERKCALSQARHVAQQAQQRVDELGIRITANESQLNILRKSASYGERQLQNLQERRDQLQENLSETGSPLEEMKMQLQQALSSHVQIEQELKLAEAERHQASQFLQDLEKKRDALIKLISGFQDELQSIQMKSQELTVRQATIVEQLAETDTRIENIIESLPEDASVPTWNERAESLARRISRLGPINLGAIEEFDTLSERKSYLDNQHEDLHEALVTLDAAIKKIDRETKARFKETFERVNAGFMELFPKIFGGGRASLELEENDLLNSGVIVRAQPPGKRNSTIHMLSGGEKALTAIALVFAMFQLNPAPFCILDEVDAPLDDVNVGRFCKLVKEMAATTQFLVISHNKVTISMANQLMGVTMHEAGVSRIVSVDIQEAIEMAEA